MDLDLDRDVDGDGVCDLRLGVARDSVREVVLDVFFVFEVLLLLLRLRPPEWLVFDREDDADAVFFVADSFIIPVSDPLSPSNPL